MISLRPPRLSHKSTDALSLGAHRIMQEGFAAGERYSDISRKIRAATGEDVPQGAVARRALDWRAEQRQKVALKEEIQFQVQLFISQIPIQPGGTS
jgi:hypothetical protein